MAKDQFQSAEHIEIRLSPFTSRVDGTEVTDDTTVTLKITKPNGDALADVTLLRATGATVVDPNTGMWKYQLNVSNYAPGTWLVKALSSGGVSAFNQRKVYTWGDYVDDITLTKTQATNAASSASSADGKCTTIAAVTSALPTFPSDPADESLLESAITAVESAVMARLGIPTASIAEDLAAVAVNVGTTKTVVQELQTITKGHWKIVGTQLLLYDALGSVLVRFNLFDDLGQPTNTRIYERVPV